jgi:catabolite regulation protein CreA
MARAVEVMTPGWKIQWGAGIGAVLVGIGSAAALASCEQKRHIVGSVNTEFKLIGPDHKIVIESYDDPKIDGITVFISKSQTGGAAFWRLCGKRF